MVKIENDCVCCEGYHCLGVDCLRRRTKHYYCDCCNDEFLPEEMYDYDNQQLCKCCLLATVPKVNTYDD